MRSSARELIATGADQDDAAEPTVPRCTHGVDECGVMEKPLSCRCECSKTAPRGEVAHARTAGVDPWSTEFPGPTVVE